MLRAHIHSFLPLNFWILSDASLERGALRLPTFPTCKFSSDHFRIHRALVVRLWNNQTNVFHQECSAFRLH